MTITTTGDLVSLLSHFHEVLDTHDGPLLSSTDLWNLPLCQEHSRADISSAPSSFCSFKSLRSGLKGMFDILDVLRALTKSLEDALSEFEPHISVAAMSQRIQSDLLEFEPENNVVARYRGIQSIPDEILSFILGYAVEDIDDVERLSLACPRFRAVLSSSPCIWADLTLTTRMSSREIAIIVDRSRGLLLSANMTGPVDLQQESRTSIILLHSSLLEELHIKWSDNLNMKFWKRFIRLDLPHVRILSLFGENRLDRIFRFWRMPRLQDLRASFIPWPTLGSNLIRCSIFRPYSWVDHGGLLDFLASAPLLEDLRVTIECTEEWEETRTETVTLRNLKSMTLSVAGDAPPSPSLLLIILSRLRTDNLSDLSIEFEAFLDESCECDLPVLQFISQQHSLLHLNVLFHTDGWSDPLFGRIKRVFTDLPSGTPTPKVVLEIPRMGMEISWATTRNRFMVPAIQRLRIGDKEDVTVWDLRYTLRMAPGAVADVRSVEVVRCPNIDEAELRALFCNTEDIRIYSA